jgi:hypothetical protein
MPRKISSLIPPMELPRPLKMWASLAEPAPHPSSQQSTTRKLGPTASLENLPSEILDQIVSYLDQATLLSVLTSSTSLNEAAAIALYKRPRFASTYRFAQFVTTVSHSMTYATMVRILDLSRFKEGETKKLPMAGWREWKMRTEPLFALTDRAPEPSWRRSSSPPPYSLQDPMKCKSTHPKAHRFLKQWETCRDVPMGAILHVLEACKRIKYECVNFHYCRTNVNSRFIDLSNLSLADDYALPPSPKHPLTAHTSLLFVSDVPKYWTWQDSDNLVKIPTLDLARSIGRLELLESISIRLSYWLDTEDIKLMLNEGKRLQKVDFRGNGRSNDTPWAVRGVADVVRSIVDVM